MKQEDFCGSIQLSARGVRSSVWRALNYFVEDCLDLSQRHLRDETISEALVILFSKINQYMLTIL